jgi:hypothetical protein
MPASSAICDMVTADSPCSATILAVVSMMESLTERRCPSIVSFLNFGTAEYMRQAAFVALATAGLTSTDTALVRGAYVSMDVITWYLIVPASFASLVTGVAGSLVSPWGLFRHYWVLIKLLITVPATALLILHTRPIGYMAHAAAEAALLWRSSMLFGCSSWSMPGRRSLHYS